MTGRILRAKKRKSPASWTTFIIPSQKAMTPISPMARVTAPLAEVIEACATSSIRPVSAPQRIAASTKMIQMALSMDTAPCWLTHDGVGNSEKGREHKICTVCDVLFSTKYMGLCGILKILCCGFGGIEKEDLSGDEPKTRAWVFDGVGLDLGDGVGERLCQAPRDVPRRGGLPGWATLCGEALCGRRGGETCGGIERFRRCKRGEPRRRLSKRHPSNRAKRRKAFCPSRKRRNRGSHRAYSGSAR